MSTIKYLWYLLFISECDIHGKQDGRGNHDFDDNRKGVGASENNDILSNSSAAERDLQTTSTGVVLKSANDYAINFWINADGKLVECSINDTCSLANGNTCSDGNTGILCNQCANRYSRRRLHQSCQKCPEKGKVYNGLLAFFFCFYLFFYFTCYCQNGGMYMPYQYPGEEIFTGFLTSLFASTKIPILVQIGNEKRGENISDAVIQAEIQRRIDEGDVSQPTDDDEPAGPGEKQELGTKIVLTQNKGTTETFQVKPAVAILRIIVDYFTLSCAVLVVADLKPYMPKVPFFLNWLESFSDPFELGGYYSCLQDERKDWYMFYTTVGFGFFFGNIFFWLSFGLIMGWWNSRWASRAGEKPSHYARLSGLQIMMEGCRQAFPFILATSYAAQGWSVHYFTKQMQCVNMAYIGQTTYRVNPLAPVSAAIPTTSASRLLSDDDLSFAESNSENAGVNTDINAGMPSLLRGGHAPSYASSSSYAEDLASSAWTSYGQNLAASSYGLGLPAAADPRSLQTYVTVNPNISGLRLAIDIENKKCEVGGGVIVGFVFFGFIMPFLYYRMIVQAEAADGLDSAFRQQQFGFLTTGLSMNFAPIKMLAKTAFYGLIASTEPIGMANNHTEIVDPLVWAILVAVVCIILNAYFSPFVSVPAARLERFSLWAMVFSCVAKMACGSIKTKGFTQLSTMQHVSIVVAISLHVLFMLDALNQLFSRFFWSWCGCGNPITSLLERLGEDSIIRGCFLKDGDKEFDFGNLTLVQRRGVIVSLSNVLEHFCYGFHGGSKVDPASIIRAAIKRVFIEKAKMNEARAQAIELGKEGAGLAAAWTSNFRGGFTRGDPMLDKIKEVMEESGQEVKDNRNMNLVKLPGAKSRENEAEAMLNADAPEDDGMKKRPAPVDEIDATVLSGIQVTGSEFPKILAEVMIDARKLESLEQQINVAAGGAALMGKEMQSALYTDPNSLLEADGKSALDATLQEEDQPQGQAMTNTLWGEEDQSEFVSSVADEGAEARDEMGGGGKLGAGRVVSAESVQVEEGEARISSRMSEVADLDAVIKPERKSKESKEARETKRMSKTDAGRDKKLDTSPREKKPKEKKEKKSASPRGKKEKKEDKKAEDAEEEF